MSKTSDCNYCKGLRRKGSLKGTCKYIYKDYDADEISHRIYLDVKKRNKNKDCEEFKSIGLIRMCLIEIGW